jgi:hypothetical protein
MWLGLQVENSKYLRECYTNTWGEANCEKVTAVSCGKCAEYCHYLRPTQHLVIAIVNGIFHCNSDANLHRQDFAASRQVYAAHRRYERRIYSRLAYQRFCQSDAAFRADVHPVLQSAQAEILNLQKDIRKHAPTHDNKNNITKHLKVVDRARFVIY